MTDKGLYPGSVELFEPFDKVELRAQAAVRAIVAISGNQQRVGLLVEREVDDPLVGVEGCLADGCADVVRQAA